MQGGRPVTPMNNFILRAELEAQSAPVRKNRSIFEKLARLRVELVDQAYLLEHRGRRDAADLAIMISARVGEICDDPELARLDSDSPELDQARAECGIQS
jgi:hypothetical protein